MIDGRGSPASDTEQMATGRKVVRNTAVLSVGQAVTLVTMTLWTMIVARYIGPETYGIYGYAQATLAVNRATNPSLVQPSFGSPNDVMWPLIWMPRPCGLEIETSSIPIG